MRLIHLLFERRTLIQEPTNSSSHGPETCPPTRLSHCSYTWIDPPECRKKRLFYATRSTNISANVPQRLGDAYVNCSELDGQVCSSGSPASRAHCSWATSSPVPSTTVVWASCYAKAC